MTSEEQADQEYHEAVWMWVCVLGVFLSIAALVISLAHDHIDRNEARYAKGLGDVWRAKPYYFRGEYYRVDPRKQLSVEN